MNYKVEKVSLHELTEGRVGGDYWGVKKAGDAVGIFWKRADAQFFADKRNEEEQCAV